MTRKALLDSIEAARQGRGYRHYLQVRDRVVDMLEEAPSTADRPSDYWLGELAGFEYMLDASPLIVGKLREHCYHLTGLRSYEYRAHHARNRDAFRRKLERLRQLDDDDLFVPEAEVLGGFGHAIDGDLVNIDTLKFYECMIALNKAGFLSSMRSGERHVVMEIGGGWGGFMYQLKTLFPDHTYVIVDLPQTLLFSSIYLKACFPSASTFMYGDSPMSTLADEAESYDFIFLPHYVSDTIDLNRLDLVINMASFQEMTSQQLDDYARKVRELGCRQLYSLNRDRSPNNPQPESVSSVLSRYYDLKSIPMLNVPYTSVGRSVRRREVQAIRSLARRILRPRNQLSSAAYRHLAGTV